MHSFIRRFARKCQTWSLKRPIRAKGLWSETEENVTSSVLRSQNPPPTPPSLFCPNWIQSSVPHNRGRYEGAENRWSFMKDRHLLEIQCRHFIAGNLKQGVGGGVGGGGYMVGVRTSRPAATGGHLSSQIMRQCFIINNQKK